MDFDNVTFVIELQFPILGYLPASVMSFQASLGDFGYGRDIEQKDSLSDSSSLYTAYATAEALASAFTDGAALGSPPRGV